MISKAIVCGNTGREGMRGRPYSCCKGHERVRGWLVGLLRCAPACAGGVRRCLRVCHCLRSRACVRFASTVSWLRGSGFALVVVRVGVLCPATLG